MTNSLLWCPAIKYFQMVHLLNPLTFPQSDLQVATCQGKTSTKLLYQCSTTNLICKVRLYHDQESIWRGTFWVQPLLKRALSSRWTPMIWRSRFALWSAVYGRCLVKRGLISLGYISLLCFTLLTNFVKIWYGNYAWISCYQYV